VAPSSPVDPPFDDDLPDPSPPDAERVARRTLVLAAVCLSSEPGE